MAEVVLNIPGGTYTESQLLEMSVPVGYGIRYTTDGTDPVLSSVEYTGPVRVWRPATTVKAVAVFEGALDGEIVSNDYQITPGLAYSFSGGAFYDSVVTDIACSDGFYSIFYTTDGSDPQANGVEYSGPLTITASCTVYARAMHDSVVCSGVFELVCQKYKKITAYLGCVWHPTFDAEYIDVRPGLFWGASKSLDVDTIYLWWGKESRLDLDTAVAWGTTAWVDSLKDIIFERMRHADSICNLDWEKQQQADSICLVPWTKTAQADKTHRLPWSQTRQVDYKNQLLWDYNRQLAFALDLKWVQLDPLELQCDIPWTKLRPLDVTNFSAFQPGDITLAKKRIPVHAGLPWISAARLIMTKQHITFKRVADNEPIRIITGSFGIDENSWDYQISGVVPSREDMEKVRPNALGVGTGQVEVELSVNGYAARFFIDTISENRQWAKGTYSITGRSPSCALGPGVCLPETTIFENTNAEQIVAGALAGTGWTYQWDLISNTWNINGEFSVIDKTKIEIISEIAKAVGGIVQTDPLEKKIILKKRHPIQPKDYAGATADEYLLSGVLVQNAMWQTAMKYNQVVVRGKETGCFLTVRRDGSAGDIPAPEIMDPLLTAQAINIERGRAFLDANGYDFQSYSLEIPLPELGSGQRPKMLFPCELIEVFDGNETWRGRVTSAEIGFEPAKTRQRVNVERYYIN